MKDYNSFSIWITALILPVVLYAYSVMGSIFANFLLKILEYTSLRYLDDAASSSFLSLEKIGNMFTNYI